MLAIVAGVVVFALVGSIIASMGGGTGQAKPPSGPEAERIANLPTIVLINTDDQRWDTLWAMPNVKKEIAGKGMTFEEAFVVNPVCCPSRAALLSGAYSHTNGVYDNKGPEGGFRSFGDAGTVATFIDVDYDTGLFGKYLNNYSAAAARGYIPLGWDEWVAFDREGYHDYKLNINGQVSEYGRGLDTYSSDVLTDHIVDFLKEGTDPKFVYFAPATPHQPADYPPAYDDMFTNLKKWRPTSYNEPDNSDKPEWASSIEQMDREHQKRTDDFRIDQYRALAALDDSIQRIIDALEETGRMDNTLFIFTSDNGMLWGEHRFTGKNVAYEESIRVPMVMRWDGHIKPGSRTDALVTNIDLTPTITAIDDEKAPASDGMSLLPLFKDPNAKWRDAFLIEHYAERETQRIPTYCAVRTKDMKYIDYFWGGDELYDLKTDPREEDNVINDPAMAGKLREMIRHRDELCKPEPPASITSAAEHLLGQP